MDAFTEIFKSVKEKKDSFDQYSEALVVYCLHFTNQCNASNINIMRSGLEFLKFIVQSYSIGPRIASMLIPCLLNKVVSLL